MAEAGRGEAALRPEIGLGLGIGVVINATIGTGIFKTPAGVAREAGSMSAALGVWVAGGVIALCGALTLAELAAALPRAGGLYEYLRRAWGDRVGFIYGWAKLTLLIPAAVGSFAKLAAEATVPLFGWGPSPLRDNVVSVGLVAVCAALNVIGVRASAVQQAVITAAKYLGVALLAVIGLALVAHPIPAPVDTPPAFHTSPTWLGCFAALVSVMWAYDGWADLASLGGETRNPGRTLPRALIAGTAAIVVVYLAANLGYARALGLDGLRIATKNADGAGARMAVATLGAMGQKFLALLILISCVGGCMSSLLTGPRVFVPLATDKLFIDGLGEVSPRSGVPARAILVSAALGAAYVLFRSFEQLSDAFVVGYFPFYMLAIAAVFVLRRREPDLPRPFRVPGWPVVPLVFLGGAAALMIGAVAGADSNGLIALGVLAAGFPMQWLIARSRQSA